MKNSLYIKIAPYTTMATGIILIAYNLLLLQNPKYGQVDTYFIAGTMFVGTGITLLINRSIGIRMYAVLTWLATAFLCYVILLAFAAMANPFFLNGLLLNEQRQLSYGIQIGFYIGLVIYMHKTRRRLFGYGKKSDQPKRPWYKRAWVYVTALIAIPPLGLFLMWKYAPWRLRVKQIVTVPLILTSLIFSMTFAGIPQGAADRSAQAGDEKVRMENFLEQKYAKKFTVKSGKIENGGDAMFGVRFKTYKAEVSPRDDPETVFSASRIVSGESLDGGADDPDEVNYHDEYLTTLWTNELRGQVGAAASGAPGNVFEFSFDVSLAGNRRSRAEFYQAIWGTVPRYSDLPA